jgi:hypothetical protein
MADLPPKPFAGRRELAPLLKPLHKKKTPVGGGRFRGTNLGEVGSSIIHVATSGGW